MENDAAVVDGFAVSWAGKNEGSSKRGWPTRVIESASNFVRGTMAADNLMMV